jgi:hypothetical protein
MFLLVSRINKSRGKDGVYACDGRIFQVGEMGRKEWTGTSKWLLIGCGSSSWFLSLNGLVVVAAGGVEEGTSTRRGCEASFVRPVAIVVGQNAWRLDY